MSRLREAEELSQLNEIGKELAEVAALEGLAYDYVEESNREFLAFRIFRFEESFTESFRRELGTIFQLHSFLRERRQVALLAQRKAVGLHFEAE